MLLMPARGAKWEWSQWVQRLRRAGPIQEAELKTSIACIVGTPTRKRTVVNEGRRNDQANESTACRIADAADAASVFVSVF